MTRFIIPFCNLQTNKTRLFQNYYLKSMKMAIWLLVIPSSCRRFSRLLRDTPSCGIGRKLWGDWSSSRGKPSFSCRKSWPPSRKLPAIVIIYSNQSKTIIYKYWQCIMIIVILPTISIWNKIKTNLSPIFAQFMARESKREHYYKNVGFVFDLWKNSGSLETKAQYRQQSIFNSE